MSQSKHPSVQSATAAAAGAAKPGTTRRGFLAASGALGVLAAGSQLSVTSAKESDAADKADAAAMTVTTGSAVGKNGHVDVEVVLDSGKIDRIGVLYSHESPGLGDVSMAKLTDLIVENQTLNVDIVTGATLSSSAFLLAVADALDAAGEDSSEWQGREHAAPSDPEDIPDSFDVVVVGTGGAGFTAAITAANEGRTVLLMEKLGTTGGSTALSGGEMAVPGSWIQQQEGIEDSPEMLAQDMLAGGDDRGNPDLVNVIAEGALDASQWLTYQGGVAWEPNLLFFGGHSVKRSIIPKGHKGNAMTTKLAGRVADISSITMVDNMRATELVVQDGAVCGVRAESSVTGKQYEFACGAVVLATGGFGANIEMRAQANPDFGDRFNSTDCVGAQGDGITMGTAAGADTVDMELIQTYPICDVDTGALIYLDDMRLDQRTVMFNKEGKRFVEELGRRDVLSEAILAQTGEMAYEIWDQAAADETLVVEIHHDEFENLSSRKLCVMADTLEECCEPFGIDAAALKETLDHWNEMCEKGEDADFGYRGTMTKIETPPYYVVAYKPAVHYTMGGLRIDTQAQVLDEEGAPIPGLFAAGEVAGGKMGTNRLGSTSMSDIYTFGRIAGQGAADYTGK